MSILNIVLIFSLAVNVVVLWSNNPFYTKTLKMANTVNPIISMIAEDLGEYENIQISTGSAKPALGGKLIYKREPCDNCISGIKNQYYIRVYEWLWEEDRLWYRPLRDERIDAHSCIAEEDLRIPYWDEKLQNAVLGENYYVN